jgi:hypothetical protein
VVATVANTVINADGSKSMTTATQSSSDSTQSLASTAFVHSITDSLASFIVAQPAAVTGLSATYPLTTIYTPSTAGRYRVTCSTVITQAATTSSTLGNCQPVWTDATTNATTFGGGGGGATSGGNVVSANTNTTIYMDVAAGTPIKMQVSTYASSGATPMQYKLFYELERLQ